MSDAGRIGFFGKVPSLGDFVIRRLPVQFVGPWDAWLQAGLADSRARLGDAWLPSYLSSPIWRFALGPGVCGARAWAGVMMPSVDRVGRYFPLTIGAGLDAAPAGVRDASWYAQLESLALSALVPGFSLSGFDAALCALSALSPGADGADPVRQVWPGAWPPPPRQAWFNSCSGAGDAPRLLGSRDLPNLEMFCAMFGANTRLP